MTGQKLHATCVAYKADSEHWSGLLFCGPSGSGKSDLALRFLHDLGAAQARLVSDDYVDIHIVEGKAEARAPSEIAGKLEIRGLGIVEVPTLACAPVDLAFTLVTAPLVRRMPDPDWLEIADDALTARIPLFALAPFETSAVAKVVASSRNVLGLSAEEP